MCTFSFYVKCLIAAEKNQQQQQHSWLSVSPPQNPNRFLLPFSLHHFENRSHFSLSSIFAIFHFTHSLHTLHLSLSIDKPHTRFLREWPDQTWITLGRQFANFAYPHGNYSENAKRCFFSSIFQIRRNICSFISIDKIDPFRWKIWGIN